MSDLQWYVVHTHPQLERPAEINLRRQGFKTYLPLYLRKRRHARKTETVARPLFPRYIFVGLDLARDRWRAVQSTIGVRHLVLSGERPAAVPAGIIDEIRARETSEGFITLGLPPGIGPGSRVRLIDGIFAEAKGVLEKVIDERRVQILLELLGREVRVFVPTAVVGTV